MNQDPPLDRNASKRGDGARIALLILALCYGYAAIRYHVVREVPFPDEFLFIANKALALAATLTIGLSFLLGPLARFFPRAFVSRLHLRKSLGLYGFALASVHAVLSLVLLTPARYPKFFDASGAVNLIGEGVFLSGALTFLIFTLVALASVPRIAARMDGKRWKSIQRLGYLAYFFVLLHVVIMGFSGWLQASSYRFGLISISLIAALAIILVFLMRALAAVLPRKE